MPTNEATQKIASLFMKAVKNNDYSEIDSLSLDEMIAADIDLGALDRDSSYRLAIKKRIKELEEAKKEEIRHIEHNRNLIVSWVSIAAAVIIALLSWFIFS